MRRPITMKRSSSRFASRWAPALVATLVLAACGGADDSVAPVGTPPEESSESTTPTDGLRAPTPIEVVGGGSGGAASAEAAPALDDQMSTDMRIAPWVVEYVIGDGMPALPTNDTGYVFDATSPVTAEQVASIAAAFGVAGEPVRIDEGYGVSWRVGPDDGSAASVWVYDDAQQNWNYNAPWGEGSVREACAVSVDSEGNENSDCPEPTPPVGVPTAGEAEQRARDLMSALGLDPAALKFEVFADEWSASVNVSDGTDDRAAVRSWYFGFGAEGVLQYGGGTLAPAEPVGPYPLVDLDTAVARLSDGFYGGGIGIAVAEPAIDVASEPASEPVEGDVVESEPALGEPMPVEPLPEGEPVVITLVDVQPDLWWAWDADGSAWLLPAYRFIDSDGGWHVAPAVTDEFLIQADPGTIGVPLPAPEPLPVEPPVEPLPVETAPPVQTAPPADGGAVDPITDPEGALPTLEGFVGLSLEEFTAGAKEIGFTTRIAVLDGEVLAGTADYRTDRVNVVVEGPRVVAIDSIG